MLLTHMQAVRYMSVVSLLVPYSMSKRAFLGRDPGLRDEG